MGSETKQFLHLRQEIIEEEVVSRLPGKSILKFRCVSKSWHCLIDSKRFINYHLQNSTKNTAFPQNRAILKRDGELKQCSLQSLLDDQSIIDLSPLDVPMNMQGNDVSISVVGCCNGLICIVMDDIHFFLWNPCTRVVKKLPEVDHAHDVMWSIRRAMFGWDESSDDYKVLLFVHDPYPLGPICKIYSSKTNTWKTVEHEEFHFSFGEEAFVSGKLHWQRRKRSETPEVASFDLKTDMFEKIELPLDVECSTLGVLGGCLCAAYSLGNSRKAVDVWVMKQYGVKDSWEKLVTLPQFLELLRPPFSHSSVIFSNGEILLCSGSTFIDYSLKDNKFRILGHKPYLYIESLVSPSV